MTIYEGRSFAAETEPFGLLTEGAAGIAVIVLAIIGLSGTQPGILAAIATIVIGVGLMVQGFNTATEYSRATASSVPGAGAVAASGIDVGGDVMSSFGIGLAGIVLGILGLLAIHTEYLIPAAVIVFGAGLLLAGSLSIGRGSVTIATPSAQPGAVAATTRHYGSSVGASGLEIMVGVAVVILGILSIVFVTHLAAAAAILALVALIAIGAAMLVVSASFGGAVTRLFS
ncbi:MAG: hypothetical protein ACREE1_01415 [Stellaceae bacterium]